MKKILLLAALAALTTTAVAEEGAAFGRSRGGDVAPVNNPQYVTECGSCHGVYPPGLLPARSWQKLMGDLGHHFGDDASLAEPVRKALTDYLVADAADRSEYRRSQKVMASLAPEAVPLRISELPYIRQKHRELPARLIAGNPQVRTLANCSACHANAAQGDFNEHAVRIPGVQRGGWEDDD